MATPIPDNGIKAIDKLIVEGRFGLAREALERAQPGLRRAATLYRLAAAEFRAGDFSAAEEAFRAVLVDSPENYNAAYSLGVSLEKQGQLDGALDSYEMAVDLKPDYSEALAKVQALSSQNKLSVRSGQRRGAAVPHKDPSRAPATTSPPIPPSSASSVVGVVTHFRERRESFHGQLNAIVIWLFRLERFDPHGNSLGIISVEMRGWSMSGSIEDGDWVEIDEKQARRRKGNGLRPTLLYNLSTGDTIQANRPWLADMRGAYRGMN